MREAAFGKCLLKIGRLSAGQRSQAFRALALAEAGVAIEGRSDGEVACGGGASPDAPLPPVLTVGVAAEPRLFAKIGRDRVESFGCPHCSSAEVRAAVPRTGVSIRAPARGATYGQYRTS